MRKGNRMDPNRDSNGPGELKWRDVIWSWLVDWAWDLYVSDPSDQLDENRMEQTGRIENRRQMKTMGYNDLNDSNLCPEIVTTTVMITWWLHIWQPHGHEVSLALLGSSNTADSLAMCLSWYAWASPHDSFACNPVGLRTLTGLFLTPWSVWWSRII